MRLTEPTRSTLKFIRKRDEKLNDLRRELKAKGIRVPRRIYRQAYERGAVRG